MSNLINAMKSATNYSYTANGGVAHKTTMSEVGDLFALGGAYRQRSDEDCITLFAKAFDEDATYALRCLFHIRDIRSGMGERRFFRVCMNWLANERPESVKRNLKYFPEMGRWDDLFVLIGTPVERDMWALLTEQFLLDMRSKGAVSLLGKWLPSANSRSIKTRALGLKCCEAFGVTEREYRKGLTYLRKKIKIVETMITEGRFDEIEYDKLSSGAGFKYRNVFARKDAERYQEFMNSKTTKVNAGTIYPYELVRRAREYNIDKIERATLNKYWENLDDVFAGADLNALVVVDTSGSMTWGMGNVAPIDIAVSLGMYAAEKAPGPFHKHYISFASRPQLIAVEGKDFVDKVQRIVRTNLCDNTNLEATFDMILNTAVRARLSADDMPKSIVVISDMQIDRGTYDRINASTMMEGMRNKWARAGYTLPRLVYWNCNATRDTFLDDGPNVTYVSGCSPMTFKQVISDKNGWEMIKEVLDAERYAKIEA